MIYYRVKYQLIFSWRKGVINLILSNLSNLANLIIKTSKFETIYNIHLKKKKMLP